MHSKITDIIVDIVQNSIEAKSSLIILDFIEKSNILEVYVSDNGVGMDNEKLKQVVDPFFTDITKHKNRRVGLGIPFIKQTCEMVGGEFSIDSVLNEGTSVYFKLPLDNIDCPPLGNIIDLFSDLMIFSGDYELVINRIKQNGKYTIIRSELINALGDLNDCESIILLKKYIKSLEDDLNK